MADAWLGETLCALDVDGKSELTNTAKHADAVAKIPNAEMCGIMRNVSQKLKLKADRATARTPVV